MTNRDKQPALDQAALDSLSVDRSDEVRDRACRLGEVVQRNLDHAIANPEIWSSSGILEDDMWVATTAECRVGNHQSAFLQFDIPPQFQALEDKPEWLNHTERMALRLNVYDVHLSEGIDMATADIPDAVDELWFCLTPAPEYSPEQDGDDPHVATYPDGSRLDHQRTEAVIGVLAFLAEQTLPAPE